MKNFSSQVNWYPNNVMDTLKDDPETVTEVTPPEYEVAKDVPEYPAIVESGDELEATELIEDNNELIDQGE